MANMHSIAVKLYVTIDSFHVKFRGKKLKNVLVSCTVQKCPSTHKFRLKSQIRKRVLSNYMSKLIANKLSNFMSKLTSNVKFEKKIC